MNPRFLVIFLFLLCFAAPALAQEQHDVAWDITAEQSDYTVQHVLEVGDMPGHNLRLAELVRDYAGADGAPVFEGVRVTREVNRFVSDYVDINGAVQGYTTYLLETGDAIFGRLTGNSHTLLNDDGSLSETSFTGVVTLSGGSGAFQGIRGLLRYEIVAQPRANLNRARVEGVYWMEGMGE